MHEHSLMKNLMEKIEQIASEQSAERVVGVKVWLGALSHMSPGHFAEHFEDASAGTLAWLPVWDAGAPEACLRQLGRKGFLRVGLNEKAEQALHEAAPTRPLALVLGGEGRGLSHRVRQELDLQLMLPMSGHVESLNASVAAGITLYHLSRESKRTSSTPVGDFRDRMLNDLSASESFLSSSIKNGS